ncbi:hypothetical protein DFH06DRAFT_1238658, partial [Mycena polygramma]
MIVGHRTRSMYRGAADVSRSFFFRTVISPASRPRSPASQPAQHASDSFLFSSLPFTDQFRLPPCPCHWLLPQLAVVRDDPDTRNGGLRRPTLRRPQKMRGMMWRCTSCVTVSVQWLYSHTNSPLGSGDVLCQFTLRVARCRVRYRAHLVGGDICSGMYYPASRTFVLSRKIESHFYSPRNNVNSHRDPYFTPSCGYANIQYHFQILSREQRTPSTSLLTHFTSPRLRIPLPFHIHMNNAPFYILFICITVPFPNPFLANNTYLSHDLFTRTTHHLFMQIMHPSMSFTTLFLATHAHSSMRITHTCP